MPGAVKSPMSQKLAALGFGPCRHAVPLWVEKVVRAASVDKCPGCVGVHVGRNPPLKAG